MTESLLDSHQRARASERYRHLSEAPLLVLALLMVPLLLIPLVLDLPDSVEEAVVATDYLIWALFAMDYVVRLYLAPRRWQFVRRNVPDLFIVVIPFLRPLRIVRSARALRLLRLARLGAFAHQGLRELRKVLRTRGLNYVLLIVLATTLTAAGLMAEFERASPTANIHGFGDALWWAFTTVTTVGYGDRFPTTAPGRGLGVMLMVAGISAFGVLTAAVAAYFVDDNDDETSEQTALMREIVSRLDALERRLAEEASSKAPETTPEPPESKAPTGTSVARVPEPRPGIVR